MKNKIIGIALIITGILAIPVAHDITTTFVFVPMGVFLALQKKNFIY